MSDKGQEIGGEDQSRSVVKERGTFVGQTLYWKDPIYLNGLPDDINAYSLAPIDPLSVRTSIAERVCALKDLREIATPVQTKSPHASYNVELAYDGMILRHVLEGDSQNWEDLDIYTSRSSHDEIFQFVQSDPKLQLDREKGYTGILFRLVYMRMKDDNRVFTIVQIRDDNDLSRTPEPREVEAILRRLQPSYYSIGMHETHKVLPNPYLL